MNIFEKLDLKITKLPKQLREFVAKSKKIHPNRHQALFDFLEENDFKTGLEIGTSAGYSAVMFILRYPEATLDTIDIVKRPLNLKLFEATGTESRINIITGDSSQIPVGKVYDYILIDGDHHYTEAKKDWLNIQSHVKSGTCVIFDDLKHPNPSSVKKLWKELQNTYTGGEIRNLNRSIGVVKIK